MYCLKGHLFLLILFSLIFLLGRGIAMGMASLSQGIRILQTVPAKRGSWIIPDGGMVGVSIGIVPRRYGYRKFPSPSPLTVWLDRRDRETEKMKWKPEAGR